MDTKEERKDRRNWEVGIDIYICVCVCVYHNSDTHYCVYHY